MVMVLTGAPRRPAAPPMLRTAPDEEVRMEGDAEDEDEAMAVSGLGSETAEAEDAVVAVDDDDVVVARTNSMSSSESGLGGVTFERLGSGWKGSC